MTLAEKLELLESHPLFSGRCPACELPIAFVGQARGDCVVAVGGGRARQPYPGKECVTILRYFACLNSGELY